MQPDKVKIRSECRVRRGGPEEVAEFPAAEQKVRRQGSPRARIRRQGRQRKSLQEVDYRLIIPVNNPENGDCAIPKRCMR